MPSPEELKQGDRIRITSVPEGDLRYSSANTVDVLKAMVGRTFEISYVDDYHPWVELCLPSPDGEIAKHFIAIMDSDSWEHANEGASE